MHPVENLRGSASRHLEGRTIVLGVCGSIAAVKSVELARELIRHGARVVPVLTGAATRIVHPDALGFACGEEPVTELTWRVEHVALLGDVPGKADLLLVAPATANTVSKMALGIDDSPVTTCATVAFGTRTPVVVAPAMHEAMLDHPVVARHARTLVEGLDVTWVEPRFEEKKAKLADVEHVAEAVMHRLANDGRRPGPLAGKRCLVVSGATAEPVDAVRILTNRSSGRSGCILATELHRLGAVVELWQGHALEPVPPHLQDACRRYATHEELMALVEGSDLSRFDQVWMPAAIADYVPEAAEGKIPSGRKDAAIPLRGVGKVIERVREEAPQAVLVAFKAEAQEEGLSERARERLERYRAAYVVANTAESFGAADTRVLLLGADGSEETFAGDKETVLRDVALRVATASTPLAARVPA